MPSNEYRTIQSAIDAAIGTDTVLVSPGTYYENIDYKGKPICITSTMSTDPAVQAAAAASTIIDGSSKGPVVASLSPAQYYQGGTSLGELDFFTIQHGGLPLPGGSATSYGGINVSYGIPSEILGNIITDNNYGGIVGGAAVRNGVLIGLGYATNNTIQNNTCWGILVIDSSVNAIGNQISGTQTPATGCSYYDPISLTTSNTNSSGVAIENANPSSQTGALLYGNTIESNVEAIVAGAPVVGGAGVVINGGFAILSDNTIRNNSAPAARGGGIDIEASAELYLTNNVVYGNQAGCGGAGIAFNYPNLRVQTVPFTPGSSEGTNDYSVLAVNNTIADNTVVANPSCTGDSQVEFVPNHLASPSLLFINNIISSSVAAPAMSCGAQATPSLLNQAVFDHNLLYNAGEAFFGNDCVDESLNGTFGNIVADPQFIRPSSGAYELTPPSAAGTGSPAIDAGNNAAFEIEKNLTYNYVNNALDILGNNRYQDATDKVDGRGTELDVIDMGAYETKGVSAPSDVVSMFMLTDDYPSMAGSGTLTAYALMGVTYPQPTATYFPNYPNGVPPTSGTITFFVDGQQVGAPAPIGVTPDITFPYDPVGYASEPYCYTPGVHTLTSTYQPVPGVNTAESAVVIANVAPVPTVINLVASPLNTTLGSAVTFSVTAAPFACSTYIPSPLSLIDVNTHAVLGTITPDPATGMGTFTTTNLHLGFNVIEASYAGNASYEASVSNEVVITVQLPTSLTVSSSLNPVYAFTPFNLMAQLTPNPSPPPTEFITFDATPSGAIIQQQIGGGAITASGSATGSVSLGAGTYSITANYIGDNSYRPSVSPAIIVTVIGNPTSLTVSSGLNPANAFQLIPLQAHISSSANVAAGSITGTISFLANGATVGSGTIDANGNATASVSLPAGSYQIVASFAGNASFAASQSTAITETVNGDTTATMLTVTPNPGYSPGGSETLTATVAATSSKTVPTGTITFYDTFNNASTALQQVPVGANGQAVFTTSTLAPGVHSITASYAASSNYQASVSTPVSLTILLSDFSLSTQSSITIQAEHHGLLPVTLTSVGSFTDIVSFSCSNLPQWTTCNFPTGDSVKLGGNGMATANIDLDTDQALNFASNSNDPSSSGWHGYAVFALLLPIVLVTTRRQRQFKGARWLMALVSFAIGATLVGCTGLLPQHTAPGTYAVTLTAKGSSTGRTHSVNFTLIVTP